MTRLEPIPTQATPAPNQALSEASVLSTPPVGMMETHGQGPLDSRDELGAADFSAGEHFHDLAAQFFGLVRGH